MTRTQVHDLTGRGLEEVVRQMPAAVVIVEAPSGKIIHHNARAREMTERQLGRPIPPELDPDFEIFRPDGRPYEMQDWPLVRSITSGEDVVGERYYNVLPDGSRLHVRCSSSPVYDQDGRIVAGVLIMEDVTERTQAEDRLAHHAGLLDNTEDAIVALDAEWNLTVWNKGAERMYGWTAEEVLGRHTTEVARLELSDEKRAALRRGLAEVGRWRGEMIAYRKDGTPLCVELITVALRDGEGRLTGFLGIHRDVTERKRAEEERSRLAQLVANSMDFIGVADLEGNVLFVNEAGQRMVGLAGIGDVRRTTVRDYFAADDRARVTAEVLPALDRDGRWTGDRLGDSELRLRHFRTGALIPVHSDIFRIDDPRTGEPYAIGTVTRDIAERRRAAEAQRESTRRIETVLESITEAFSAMDRDWRYTYVNDRALARARLSLGSEVTAAELLGKSCWELFPEALGTRMEHELRRAMREQKTVQFEAYSEATGTWVEMHAYPSEEGLSVYTRDITERRRRADQQAQVAQLGLRALTHHSAESLLQETAGMVASTLGVELTKVARVLPGGAELLICAGAGWSDGVVGERTEPAAHDSQSGYTLLSGEPVIVEDVATERRFDVPPVVREHGAVSAATVLIPGRGESYGVLGALSTRPRAFADYEVHFMQAVANILGAAIDQRQSEQDLHDAREAERRRIARDLHDEALRDLTQALTEASRAQQLSDGPEAAAQIDRLVPTLKRVGQGLRGAIYNLRLGGEETTPFPELLRTLVGLHSTMASRCELRLELHEGAPAGPLGSVGTEALRILGEALTNARRHSGAGVVCVTVQGSSGELSVEVSDDGVGFDLPNGRGGSEGTGIRGMRERAALLGGRLDIASTAGAGTRVTFRLPLAANGAAPATKAVRVLLVEDHTAVREAIATAFEQEQDFEIVGQAASLAEARTMLHDVEVAVVDLGLPDGYGADLIRDLREVNPQAQALVLSASLDRGDIAQAVESGAAGALSKTAHLDELVDSVRRLRAGETLLPLEEVVELLRYAGRRREQEQEDRLAIGRLTPRELDVLQALAEGLDSQGVADRLHITLRTQRNHVASILAKLGVHSQLQALVFALRHDVVEIR
ncbi:MAG: hypothetical protein QOH58_134 [Thermoleophilaceae bacterium]|nr:hypothetical protein [Thermoleophilaceae bacterium]